MRLQYIQRLFALAFTSTLFSLAGCEDLPATAPIDSCQSAEDCEGALTCVDHTCAPSSDDAPVCGDGTIEDGETCDDGALNGEPLQCNTTCDGNTEPACGNGVIEDDEICDDGELNGDVGQCNLLCTGVGLCGNGTIDEDEACDDGALNGQPLQCNTTCDGTTEPVCGNDVIEDGETCDDGALNGEPLHCDTTCQGITAPICGNGITEEGEACDDGEESITCNADCTQPVAFRIQTAEIIEPGIYYDVPLRSCRDLRNVGVSTMLPGGVNGLIRTEFEETQAEPNQHLHAMSIALLTRPLTQLVNATYDIDYAFPVCDTNLETCTYDPAKPSIMSAATNIEVTGACLPAEEQWGRRAAAYPGLNNPQGNCFVTMPTDASLTIGGIALTLQDAKLVGQYEIDATTSEVTGIKNGVLMGFLPKSLADVTPVNSFPLSRKPMLSTFLGGAGVCVANGNTEDIDEHNGELGWWFYLNYTGGRVENWTE